MVATLFCHYGNRSEWLAYLLSHQLYQGATPFQRPWLLLAHSSFRSWLEPALFPLEQGEAQLLGARFGPIEELLPQLALQLLEAQPLTLFSCKELSIQLELLLYGLLEERIPLTSEEQWQLLPLWEALKLSPISREAMEGVKWPHRLLERLSALADSTANLLDHYSRYGAQELLRWRRQPRQPWYQQLFALLARRYPQKLLPGELLAYAVNQQAAWRLEALPPSLHLFGSSYLPTAVLAFLQTVAFYRPVHLYLLSPSRQFQGDLLSDPAQLSLFRQLEHRAAPERQQLALEAMLIEDNPLLANLGRLTRERELQLELLADELVESSGYYIIGRATAGHPAWELPSDGSLGIDRRSCPELTALEAIQSDMLLQRPPPPAQEKLLLWGEDRSLLCWAAADPWEEVAHLYDSLIQLADRYRLERATESWLVVSPQLESYLPYIHLLFGSEESPFDYRLLGQQPLRTEQKGYLSAFLQLLSLAASRWELADLLLLFEEPCFVRRWRLTPEELELIVRWCRHAAVSWGFDADHRRQLLERELSPSTSEAAETGVGSWSDAIDWLLETLVSGTTERDNELEPINGFQIAASEMSLLGRWAQLLQQLYAALLPFSSMAATLRYSWRDWTAQLAILADQFLLEVEPGCAEKTALLRQLRLLGEASQGDETQVAFCAVERRLRGALTEVPPSCSTEAWRKGAIYFAPLEEGYLQPARVIAFLGCGEAPWSKAASPPSIAGIYTPSRSDRERHLFLELLLLCRGHLLFSFCGSWEQRAGQQASAMLLELIAYLEARYCYPSSSIASRLMRSLSVEEPQPVTSELKRGQRSLFRAPTPLLAVSESATVQLQTLSQQIASPLRFYLHQALATFPDRPELRRQRGRELFGLDRSELGRMRKQSLLRQRSAAELMGAAQRRGRLPRPPFDGYYGALLAHQQKLMEEALARLGVDPRTPSCQLHFSERYTVAECTGEIWRMPPLELPLSTSGRVHLVGAIEGVTPVGLLCYGGKTVDQLVKVLPQLLAFQIARERYQLPCGSALLLVKHDAKEALLQLPSAEECLSWFERLLAYGTALEKGMASPLFPEWVSCFLEGDVQALQRKIDGEREQRDELLLWARHQAFVFDAAHLISLWQPLAQELFSPLYHWCDSAAASAPDKEKRGPEAHSGSEERSE